MFSYTFLPKLLNMTITGSVAILLVAAARLALQRAPKVISYALWGVVLFRLLCPVSFHSSLSLFDLFGAPAAEVSTLTSSLEYVPEDIVHTEFPAITLPIPAIGGVINDTLPQGEEQLAAGPLEAPIAIATCIWVAGLAVMAIHGLDAYVSLRRRLAASLPLGDNIYLSDEIASPFVLGLPRPKIYLPSSLAEGEQTYILAHERHHIRRGDHIVKALSFIALSVHWFNPLVWLAFVLAGQDMEMSCDEAVVRALGQEVRAEYSASLLSLATGKRVIAGTPLAFGEGDTKGRIQNLARWKKPALGIVAAAVLLCALLAAALFTNPAPTSTPDARLQGPEALGIPTGSVYLSGECLHMVPYSSTLGMPGDWRCRFEADGIQINPTGWGGGEFYPITDWAWQPFPYTDNEWGDLHLIYDWHAGPISQRYDEMLYLPLAKDRFLLRMDGELWLVELSLGSRLGAYIHRVDTLVFERAGGSER